MGEVIDFNALVPESVTIKIGDPPREVIIKPPSTVKVLKIGYLGQKLQNGVDLKEEEVIALVEELTAEIKSHVPELQDLTLNTAQLLMLVKIINDMGVPEDAKELEKRGISPADPKAQ